jgi:hypothetical protein
MAEGRGSRAERLQRLAHQFFDIGFPSRNTDYNSGAVQRRESILPAGKPRPQLRMDCVQLVGVPEELIEMHGESV